jgi:hypothetical protein
MRTWLFAICSLWILCACAGDPIAPPAEVTALRVHAPLEAQAGERVPVSVYAAAPDGTPVLLAAHGSFEILPLTAPLYNGRADFVLPAAQTRSAGRVRLIARAGVQEATAHLLLHPGPPVDPILPLVGPRTIWVGGEDWTMLVAVPVDEFANPVADGTGVSVRAQHPVAPGANPLDGLEIQSTSTRYLLAWTRIYSRNLAGRTFLSASAGDAFSPERDVMEIPGLPLPFRIYANPEILAADGRQLATISSETITDAYGNVLLDGTRVTLVGMTSDGSRRILPAVVQDGRIRATVQAAAEPGTLTLYADIGGVSSDTLTLSFIMPTNAAPIPIAREMSGGNIILTAGPLTGILDQFVPDGTEVTFYIVDPAGEESTQITFTENGYARLLLRQATLERGHYRVTASAGGRSGEIGVSVR